jgi:hypothetical protein
VEAARVEVRPGDIRLTESGVAADLIISEAGAAVKYNVYLSEKAIELQFRSTDRNRVELAACLLKLAGVSAEVERVGGRDEWYVRAYTDRLAAGHEELRKALARIVETARKSVGEEKAKRWLKKLGKGRVLREGWLKHYVGLSGSGALEVRFSSTDPDSVQQAAQQLREMGFIEGKHFTVEMPKEGREGYVYIRREGLVYAAWLSVHGSGDQQRLADEFAKYILQRAEEKGKNVYKKALEIVNEGKSWRSLRLEDFEGRVEVNGKTYVVKVIGWGAEIVESQSGKKLLRLKITAEVGRVEGGHIVDRVEREYTITYSRRGRNNAAVGFAVARADAPGGREADAERFSALVKALTGKEPRIRRKSDGTVEIEFGREHLDGFMCYTELSEAIARWLEETKR